MACLIEEHYGYCQDIEWAYEKGNLYVLQARKARVGGD
jgi:phosphoenolpyruvate synthase/pyruvate phosphate dikinase